MKDIKFRAWDKEEKQMFFSDNLGLDTFFHASYREKKNWEIMEYTGLRDSKRTKEYPEGQEIYDGDILDCTYKFDGCKKHKLKVVWQEDAGRFWLHNIGECHQPNVRKNIWDMTSSKIIGNIKENPELIGEKI